MTTETPIWEMLADVERANDLSDDDRRALQPAFDALRRHEVIALPELIISHVKRLHSNLCGTSG